jgi:hypothetical protein
MNAYVGCGVDQADSTGWRNYLKLTDMIAPLPCNLWVISDEQADSINDGWLVNTPGALGDWEDLPGSYHNAGDVVIFGDGHVEYRKWLDGYNAATGSGTVQPVTQQSRNGFPDAKGLDIIWWGARTSAPLQ